MKQRDPDGPLLPRDYTLYDRGNEHLHIRRARKSPWGIFAGLFGIALLAIGYLKRQTLRPALNTWINATREHELVLLLTAAAACGILLLWLGPKAQLRPVQGLTPTERFDKENEARKTLAQIVAGLVVFISLYSATKTFETTRDGQITDRFIKAIDELGATDKDGNPLLERRLGGIYALERVAQESERDHWPIMEVLTAYVRQHAPRVADEPLANAAVHPRADVQGVLTVIGRRPKKRVDFEFNRGLHLDLSETNLRGANLRGAELQRANFRLAQMQGAFLVEADLREAFLRGAHLQRAVLFGAHLQRASLAYAQMQNSVLGGAFLQDANLEGAHLEGAYLIATQLQGAHLLRAKLTQSQLNFTICDKETQLPAGLKCGIMR